jgi:Kdo2-lipid IVA lauroyltransferase/acyltransferase
MTFEAASAVQKLKFWALLAFMRALALLPWSVLDALGAALGYGFWRADSRECRIARANIDYCLPGWSPAQRSRLERATLIHFGRIALEIAKVWFGSRAAFDRAIVAVEGEALLTSAAAEGRGVLLLVPHHGNWEVLGSWLPRHYPFTAMYLPAKDAAVDGIIRMARTRSGGAVAAANNSGVRAVLKALRQGGVIGMLPDQVPKQAGAEFAPFFGRTALTMTLATNLLQKTGARAVFGCAFRADDGRGFRIAFRAADPDIYSPDLATSLAALNRGVEAMIRERPEQYQWEYKRFKTLPEGVPRMYRDQRD